MKKVIPLFLSLSFLHFFPSNAQVLEVGNKMPSFWYSKSGEFQHSSNLEGKVVLVTFCASWCPPCLRELPVLEQTLYTRFKNDNRFVLLVIGSGETRRTLNKMASWIGVNLPFVADPNRELITLFGETRLPASFLFNKNGIVKYHSTGFDGNLNYLTEQVKYLLDSY